MELDKCRVLLSVNSAVVLPYLARYGNVVGKFSAIVAYLITTPGGR